MISALYWPPLFLLVSLSLSVRLIPDLALGRKRHSGTVATCRGGADNRRWCRGPMYPVSAWPNWGQTAVFSPPLGWRHAVEAA